MVGNCRFRCCVVSFKFRERKYHGNNDILVNIIDVNFDLENTHF